MSRLPSGTAPALVNLERAGCGVERPGCALEFVRGPDKAPTQRRVARIDEHDSVAERLLRSGDECFGTFVVEDCRHFEPFVRVFDLHLGAEPVAEQPGLEIFASRRLAIEQ
jgi:hypothetical protein